MVIIIGAGLSGLLTAYRLKEEGVPFKILEARDRTGGRIHTLESKNGTPLEMGATWFTQ
jgi:monoamine oxidase